MYGSKTWTLTSDLMKQLEATEMWFLRRMLRISYKDRVTNEEVLRRANVDRTPMKDIIKRQMEFFAHIIRKEGIGKFSGNRIHRREKSQRTSDRDISAIDEGNDAHRTDPHCLRERCLVTVVQIAAYVNMIWHTMMMITKKKE